MATAPWLRPTRATELAADFPPPGVPSPLAAPSVSRFSDAYVDELKQARRRIDIYRSMVVDQSTDPDRFDTYLLLAESSDFLVNPTAGLAFIRAVRDQLSAVFGAVRPDTGQVVTLTARSGSRIPVHVTNEGDRALRVKVQLVSQHLLSSPSDTVVLQPSATQTLFFDVDLKDAALNNLVEQYLIFAEGQAMRRVPMRMGDWIAKLDGFLSLNDRGILTHAGTGRCLAPPAQRI